jgi:hypothetical protein
MNNITSSNKQLNHTNLDAIIESFDQITHKNFDEQDISSALKSLLENENVLNSIRLDAEIMAFDFFEVRTEPISGKGMYFSHSKSWNNGSSNSETKNLFLQAITPAIIDYWEGRTRESTNPILTARYSGLVWEFKKKIVGINPSLEIGKQYTNALIEIANGDFHKFEINTFEKLKRALNIAVSLNNNELIQNVKKTILEFDGRQAFVDKAGLWGLSYDLLIGHTKVNLSDKEEKQIIDLLEAKLNQLTTIDFIKLKFESWIAEGVANRLTSYYRKKNRNEDIKRILLSMEKVYLKLIDELSPIQVSDRLDYIHKMYINFNLMKEADSVLVRIRELGPKLAAMINPISHVIELPKVEMAEFLATMTQGSIRDIIYRIGVAYLPDKIKAKNDIVNLSKEYKFAFNIPHHLQDENGRHIRTIDSLDHDLNGHISKYLTISSIFLRSLIMEAIEKKGMGKNDILEFLNATPVLNTDRLKILDKALDAYFKDDFLVFIHLSIPQIEQAIRNVLEYSGGNVLKPSKGCGYNLKTFDEVLRDETVIELLTEDFADYFRILFTDQRGWNLRNNVFHGMVGHEMFNSLTADRVLHALICLGFLKLEK